MDCGINCVSVTFNWVTKSCLNDAWHLSEMSLNSAFLPHVYKVINQKKWDMCLCASLSAWQSMPITGSLIMVLHMLIHIMISYLVFLYYWRLRSSGMLCCVNWERVTDIRKNIVRSSSGSSSPSSGKKIWLENPNLCIDFMLSFQTCCWLLSNLVFTVFLTQNLEAFLQNASVDNFSFLSCIPLSEAVLPAVVLKTICWCNFLPIVPILDLVQGTA
jgi:hypothetical protein